MPPNAILCPICGKKYFKSSLPIHMKACKKKYEDTHSKCKKCGMSVENSEWQDHRSFCKDLVKNGFVSTGGDALGMPVIITNDAEYVEGDKKHDPTTNQVDPRVPCQFCSRKFNPDRINKHMMICNKIKKHSKKRKTWDGAKVRIEGTDFAQFANRRAATPEIIKEWKKHGRRWRTERDDFRVVIGSEEPGTDERDQIKSLKAPKIEVGQVGVNVISSSNTAMLRKVKNNEMQLRKDEIKETMTTSTTKIVKPTQSTKSISEMESSLTKAVDEIKISGPSKVEKKSQPRGRTSNKENGPTNGVRKRTSETTKNGKSTGARKATPLGKQSSNKTSSKATNEPKKSSAKMSSKATKTSAKMSSKATKMAEYREREKLRRQQRKKGRR